MLVLGIEVDHLRTDDWVVAEMRVVLTMLFEELFPLGCVVIGEQITELASLEDSFLFLGFFLVPLLEFLGGLPGLSLSIHICQIYMISSTSWSVGVDVRSIAVHCLHYHPLWLLSALEVLLGLTDEFFQIAAALKSDLSLFPILNYILAVTRSHIPW